MDIENEVIKPEEEIINWCMEGLEVGHLTRKMSGKKLYIRGYATVEFDSDGKKVIDNHGTVLRSVSAKKAITEAMQVWEKRKMPMLFDHESKDVIARGIAWGLDERGVWIEGEVATPFTDEEKSRYDKIKNGFICGLSVRFARATVTHEKVNGKKTPHIKFNSAPEITITAVPSNDETTFESYMRMYEPGKQETIKQEIRKMTPEQYEALMGTINGLSDKVTSIENEKAEMERKANLQTTIDEAVKTALTEKETELETLRTDLKAATDKLELSEGETDMQLTRKDANPQHVGNATETNSLDKLRKMDFGRLSAEYLHGKSLKATEGDKFRCSPTEVFGYHLEKKGEALTDDQRSELDIPEGHRAISSSTGVPKNNTLDPLPIDTDAKQINLLMLIPKVNRESKSHDWYQRTAMPSPVAASTDVFAAEGFTPTSGDSTYTKLTATLKSMYSSGKVNDFADDIGAISNLQLEIDAHRMQLENNTEWGVINGHTTADSVAFKGLMHYAEGSANYNIDKGGSVLTTDIWEDALSQFRNNQKKRVGSEKKPDIALMDDFMLGKIRKLILSKNAGAMPQAVFEMGGYRFSTNLVLGDIPCVCTDALRDWNTTKPTIALSAITGALTDATYRVTATAVTESGETDIATEATQATSSQGLRVAVTMVATYLYVRVYVKSGGGAGTTELVKTVKNTTGAGAQNVDFVADSEVVDLNVRPMNGTYESRIVFAKIGGRDGYELGTNAYLAYEVLGRVGDFLQFYLKNYIYGVLKDQAGILVLNVDYTS